MLTITTERRICLPTHAIWFEDDKITIAKIWISVQQPGDLGDLPHGVGIFMKVVLLLVKTVEQFSPFIYPFPDSMG